MSRQLYRGKILEHYREPHNYGAFDEPDVDARVSNPHCGDELHLTGRVDDDELQVQFEGEGCALSVAAASLLTDAVNGGAVDAVSDVADADVFDMLGIEKDAIAPIRVKCVLLGKRGMERMVSDDDTA